jgi:hypothetical protein
VIKIKIAEVYPGPNVVRREARGLGNGFLRGVIIESQALDRRPLFQQRDATARALLLLLVELGLQNVKRARRVKITQLCA